MLPSGHNYKKLGDVWAVLPRLNLIHKRGRKLTGWLIDKFGCLMAIYVNCRVVYPEFPPLVAYPGLYVPSFAGGLRYEGAARLKGVLNYFTRGPDQEGRGNTRIIYNLPTKDIEKLITGGMVMRYIKIIAALVVVLGILWACNLNPQRKPLERVPGAPDKEPTISLYVNEKGTRENIKLEDYLAGVVAAEMEPTWSINALAAQAIVARTFTMENIQAGRVKKLHGTDASTSVEEFQAYDPSRINDNVRKAVKMTRGKVITYQNDYIKGWFSACDGGISASAQEGLGYNKGPTKYIKAGARDGCLAVTSPQNRDWHAEIPLDRVREAVKNITGTDPGDVNKVKIVERGPSGRVTKIQIGSATVGGSELRLALGSEQVRSTLISRAEVQGNNLLLEGNGFGHGVGLCQWGSQKMANEGKDPEEIIKFYFRDVKIQKLWD
ncbi:SpoIID/LytB domain-containing protein [Desulfotruncus alcoholivorax]|uniref:SpoIID/LytB domain-containing protein n=1 Tax=Desulfotruncus alcoholivorax TaxID=265477 RepID=UPI00041DA65C|nr:SpoIID/LytB domain-containing protein [Desulfotruncus alcoholivorax]